MESKRIDELIKLPVRVVLCYNGDIKYWSWRDANEYHCAEFKDKEVAEDLRDLINGQNVDVERIAEENRSLKLDYGLLQIDFNSHVTLLASCEQALEERDKTISDLKCGSTLSKGWVSVDSEQKPEDNEIVIIVNKGIRYPAQYGKSDNKFMRYNNAAAGDRMVMYFYSSVTHWMPLPSFHQNIK